ncbi:MAG TPA: hypothetical protein PKG78_02980 [Candidatus Woesebacteria bacterium]|nr:hypothetical protein [Candidatus Woesebacteria bacterium]HOA12078.1 hypothetical protein [Candidatus Woesebacteria bacterium]
MTNINPVRPQDNFNNPVAPSSGYNSPAATNLSSPPPSSSQPPTFTGQTPEVAEQIPSNKHKSVGDGANKLWLILLFCLAIILGFWAGYFTHQYFYQSNPVPNTVINQVNQPTPVEQTFEPVSEVATAPAQINKEYIIFRDQEVYLNDGLDFTSQEQCVEDEIVILTAIEDDYLTIQMNEWTLQEDSGEYVASPIDFQVSDQACIAVRPICPNVSINRCFSLELIDGVYHLDYEFIEEVAATTSSALEAEL